MSHDAIFEVILSPLQSTVTLAFPHLLAPTVHPGFSISSGPQRRVHLVSGLDDALPNIPPDRFLTFADCILYIIITATAASLLVASRTVRLNGVDSLCEHVVFKVKIRFKNVHMNDLSSYVSVPGETYA